MANRMSRRFLGFRLAEADIRLIRIFVAVAHSGGFSAAQNELQMSVSTISRAVSDLETRMNTTLCRRGRAGFGLTPSGTRVVQLGKDLLEELDHFERNIRNMHEAEVGRIRLACVDGMLAGGDGCIQKLLGDFKRRTRAVDVELIMARPAEVELGVAEAEFDAGITVSRNQRIAHLNRIQLFEETSNLYCARNHPLAGRQITSDDLREYDYTGFNFAKGGNRPPASRDLRRAGTVSSLEAQALMIATGEYVGYLPDAYVQSIARTHDFHALLPEVFSSTTSIDLIYSSQSSNAAVAILADLAQGVAG